MELASAIARATNDPVLAEEIITELESNSDLNLLELTDLRSRHTGRIAIDCRLRGADAVYVQVAVEFGTTLITWDNEMLARAPSVVPTLTPADWFAANPV